MIFFPHRVTPVFAVVVGCLIPVPGAATHNNSKNMRDTVRKKNHDEKKF
jgi:hypothetical protein